MFELCCICFSAAGVRTLLIIEEKRSTEVAACNKDKVTIELSNIWTFVVLLVAVFHYLYICIYISICFVWYYNMFLKGTVL